MLLLGTRSTRTAKASIVRGADGGADTSKKETHDLPRKAGAAAWGGAANFRVHGLQAACAGSLLGCLAAVLPAFSRAHECEYPSYLGTIIAAEPHTKSLAPHEGRLSLGTVRALPQRVESFCRQPREARE